MVGRKSHFHISRGSGREEMYNAKGNNHMRARDKGKVACASNTIYGLLLLNYLDRQICLVQYLDVLVRLYSQIGD